MNSVVQEGKGHNEANLSLDICLKLSQSFEKISIELWVQKNEQVISLVEMVPLFSVKVHSFQTNCRLYKEIICITSFFNYGILGRERYCCQEEEEVTDNE